MEWNAESVLDALNDFERKPEINPILDDYLQRIAKNGEIIFPWCKLKPLLKKKLEVVLDEFYETCPVETTVPVPNFETFNFDNLKKSILQAVEAFTSAPFTIQRLCELVTNPQKHYNRTDKYMRGIEKNVLVVSTIEPRTGGQGDGNNTNNNNVIVNGMINESSREESDALNGHESESSDSVSSSNIEASSNHVLLENFANVFPSAACIPSASNICIKPDEIDSNFISTTSESESSEDAADFNGSTAALPDQSSEPVIEEDKHKEEEVDEPMDTTEEGEKMVVSSDDVKVSASDIVRETSDSAEENESDGVPEKRMKLDIEEQSPIDNVSSDSSDSKEMDSTVQNEVAEIEEKKSEITEESVVLSPEKQSASAEEEESSVEKSQQDDTVSQSDSVEEAVVLEPTESENLEKSEICDSKESEQLTSEDKTDL